MQYIHLKGYGKYGDRRDEPYGEWLKQHQWQNCKSSPPLLLWACRREQGHFSTSISAVALVSLTPLLLHPQTLASHRASQPLCLRSQISLWAWWSTHPRRKATFHTLCCSFCHLDHHPPTLKECAPASPPTGQDGSARDKTAWSGRISFSKHKRLTYTSDTYTAPGF